MKLIAEKTFSSFKIFHLDEVSSTMDLIKNYNFNEVIVTDRQTNGRGKGDRSWQSENNKNLYFSLNIKINEGLNYGTLSLLMGLLITKSIEEYFGSNIGVMCKWPNDIILNGKKIAGILLEADILKNQLIIGIGLNINGFPILEKKDYLATSLSNEGFEMVDKFDILKLFLKNFKENLLIWEQQGFSFFRNEYLEKLFNHNKKILVKNTEKGNTEGILEDIDNNGVLKLNTGNEILKINSGDIFNL